MIRALFRLVGLVFLAATVVAATVDGTRSIAENTLLVTPLRESWTQVSAASLAQVQALLDRAAPAFVRDAAATAVLGLPTVAVLLALAVLFLLIGRPKRDVF